MAREPVRRRSRTLRRAVAAVVALVGVVVSLVFVRLALDWSDSLPYEGATTEARYIGFILIAMAILAVGAATGVVLWIRAGRR